MRIVSPSQPEAKRFDETGGQQPRYEHSSEVASSVSQGPRRQCAMRYTCARQTGATPSSDAAQPPSFRLRFLTLRLFKSETAVPIARLEAPSLQHDQTCHCERNTGLRRDNVCIPGQRQPSRVATVTIMKPEDMKIAVVIAWALIWSVIAVSLVSSASNWILLVGSGVLPPLMIVRMWHPPARTVSASIREARK